MHAENGSQPDAPFAIGYDRALSPDQVHWQVARNVLVHTVTFPANDPRLPFPLGFDYGTSYARAPFAAGSPPPPPPACTEFEGGLPELIGDQPTRRSVPY
jgi:hypothetical protein